MTKLLGLTVAGVLIVLSAACAENPNLLINPSFEEASAAEDEPGTMPAKGWTADCRPRGEDAETGEQDIGKAWRDDADAHSGKYSLRLRSGPRQLTQLWAYQETDGGDPSTLIPVEGGKRYDFSYWASVKDAGTVIVGHLIFFDADRRPLEGKRSRLKTASKETGDRWLKIERSVVIAEEAAYVMVHFAVGWGSGAEQLAALDDVELRLHE